MEEKNIGRVVPMYMDYYKLHEDGKGTEKIHIGFVMEYFEQYDCGVGKIYVEDREARKTSRRSKDSIAGCQR